jgi:hypothetical protein
LEPDGLLAVGCLVTLEVVALLDAFCPPVPAFEIGALFLAGAAAAVGCFPACLVEAAMSGIQSKGREEKELVGKATSLCFQLSDMKTSAPIRVPRE